MEKDKSAELSNKNLTNTQKKAIEDKYQKEAAEKVKAFKAEQKASILQAVINGALAITKATSQTGILAPFVIPGIIASTAIQVATIIGQKPPQYAKGGYTINLTVEEHCYRATAVQITPTPISVRVKLLWFLKPCVIPGPAIW